MKRGRTQALYATHFRHFPKVVQQIDEHGSPTKVMIPIRQALSDPEQARRQIELAYQEFLEKAEWLDKAKLLYAELHNGRRYRISKSGKTP